MKKLIIALMVLVLTISGLVAAISIVSKKETPPTTPPSIKANYSFANDTESIVYSEMATQKSSDYYVYAYSPQCAHCNEIKPRIEQLEQKLNSGKNPSIYFLNIISNEVEQDERKIIKDYNTENKTDYKTSVQIVEAEYAKVSPNESFESATQSSTFGEKVVKSNNTYVQQLVQFTPILLHYVDGKLTEYYIGGTSILKELNSIQK